ncbi:MAG: lysylphosphatidylglycerol synthase transmembrane domain-containing protein [Candidatus Rokuibacteriota bacterium]
MRAPRLLRRLTLVAGLGAAVALGLALAANLPATLETLARFPPGLLPVIIGAILVNYGLRFAKWQLYLRRLDIPLPAGQSLLVFLAGFTMSITPGKLGEVLKAFLVRDLAGTEVGRTASVVMAERLTDVAGLLVLSLLGATVLPFGGVLLTVVAAGLAVAVLALRTRWLGEALHRLVARAPRRARLAGALGLFLGAGRTLLAPGILTGTVALSVVSWFFECLAFHVILQGLGLPTSLPVATFLYAFASLAGAVSMLPGGLGVAEGSLTGLLVALGTPLPEAAAATLLVRAVTLWLAVGIGTTTLVWAFRGGPSPAGEGPSPRMLS